MNSIEEKLWNYIDGSCTADEQQAIARLIAQDEVYRRKYHELLKLNEEFSRIELDEPSMAFTYNVMETIRTEQAMKPLKATVNKRLILGIAAFFIISVAVLLVFALSNANWSTAGSSGIKLTIPVNVAADVTHIQSYITAPFMKGFLFFDVVMGLFIMDTYLRRRNALKQP